MDVENAITYKQILLVNKLCLFEGEEFRVLDENRIKAALGNQFQPYEFDELVYASVFKSLILNHGFMNGNKRTAAILLYLSTLLTGTSLIVNDEELAKLIYRIAGEGGSQIPVQEIAGTIYMNVGTSGLLFPIFDFEDEVKEYIKKHQWLMKELGK